MVYDFGDWPQAIEDISTLPEFMTATVEFHNPSLVTHDYDVETGEDVTTGNSLVFTTRARVIGIRSQINTENAQAYNPTGIKAIRVAFPSSAYTGRIERGWQVRVLSSSRNPELSTYVFIVEADNFNTNRAARNIECAVDVEVESGDEVVDI